MGRLGDVHIVLDIFFRQDGRAAGDLPNQRQALGFRQRKETGGNGVCSGWTKKVHNGNAEGFCKLYDFGLGNIVFARFDFIDRRTGFITQLFCEFFLRHIKAFASSTDICAEGHIISLLSAWYSFTIT